MGSILGSRERLASGCGTKGGLSSARSALSVMPEHGVSLTHFCRTCISLLRKVLTFLTSSALETLVGKRAWACASFLRWWCELSLVNYPILLIHAPMNALSLPLTQLKPQTIDPLTQPIHTDRKSRRGSISDAPQP